jgi:hypothetical protein
MTLKDIQERTIKQNVQIRIKVSKIYMTIKQIMNNLEMN